MSRFAPVLGAIAAGSYLSVQLASPEDARRLGLPQGASIQLSLSPSDVTSVEEIDTFMPGYTQFGAFRSDEVAPIMLVDKNTDRYRIFSLNNAFRRLHVETSYQARIGEVDPETQLDTYLTLPRGLGSFIPADTAAMQNYDVRQAAGRRIKDVLDIDREVRLWTLLTTLNNWGTAQRTTLTAGFQWNGGASSNPILDLQARIRASAQRVTGTYFGLEAAYAFLGHDKVRDHMRQMLGDAAPNLGILSGAGISPDPIDFIIPGFPPFHVVHSKVLNDSTGNLDEIIGKHAVLVSNPPGADPQDGQAIMTVKTFRVRGPSGTGFTSREFDVNDRGLNGGRMLVSGHDEEIRFVSNIVGGLIRDVVQ